MASKTWVAGTVIDSPWLQDTNDVVYNIKNVTFYATGNDDSVSLQSFIDSNKGKEIIIKGTCTFAGVSLSGSSYNNTRLIVQDHLLSVRPTSGTNTFGGAYVGLLFKDCDGCELTYRGNGQRTLQPDEEHIYLVGVAGASNLHIYQFDCKEIKGDGIYVSQSNWLANTTTTRNLVIDSFKAYNSSDDGRNALSLIAYDGVTIGTFQSINVGGVVGGVRQPGGLDVEPNQTYQTCNGLTIGSATVRSIGTTCFGVQGKDAGSESYVVTGVFVGALDSVNTLGVSASDGTWALNLFQVNDVQIRGRAAHTTSTAGLVARIDSAIGVVVDLTVGPGLKCVVVGENGWVRKSNIKLNIRSYAGSASGVGLRAVGVTDTTFSGRITGATSASSTFAVHVRSNGRALTQTNVKYSIDAPKDTNARGYRNEPTDAVAFSNCLLCDCDLTGYASWTTAFEGFGVAGIRKRNINNLTDITIMPTDGGWTQGDVVHKSNATKDANNMTLTGWYRLTTGTGAVLGTDWAAMNVSHVSPAV